MFFFVLLYATIFYYEFLKVNSVFILLLCSTMYDYAVIIPAYFDRDLQTKRRKNWIPLDEQLEPTKK